MAENNSREAIEIGSEVKSEILGGKWTVKEITDYGVSAVDFEGLEIFFPHGQYKPIKSKLGGLTIKLDVDCSEAITGLKAIQREAREATKAIRELEATINEQRKISK